MPIGNEKVKCYSKDGRIRLIYKELTQDAYWMKQHELTLAEVELPPVIEEVVTAPKTSTKKK